MQRNPVDEVAGERRSQDGREIGGLVQIDELMIRVGDRTCDARAGGVLRAAQTRCLCGDSPELFALDAQLAS